MYHILDQFNSVFSTPKPDMIISDPVSFFSCQSIPIGAEINYLSDIDFSESIIVESIKELSSNPAAGPGGFPYSLLIKCSVILAPALNLMFSQSLTQGIFPSALKRAVIVPILKSGYKSIPGNYRPISLISCISKVFERIITIRKQVLAFLERKGLLNNTGSKRHSLQAVELSQQTQAAVQIVSNLPAPSNGVPIYHFWACRPCGPAEYMSESRYP